MTKLAALLTASRPYILHGRRLPAPIPLWSFIIMMAQQNPSKAMAWAQRGFDTVREALLAAPPIPTRRRAAWLRGTYRLVTPKDASTLLEISTRAARLLPVPYIRFADGSIRWDPFTIAAHLEGRTKMLPRSTFEFEVWAYHFGGFGHLLTFADIASVLRVRTATARSLYAGARLRNSSPGALMDLIAMHIETPDRKRLGAFMTLGSIVADGPGKAYNQYCELIFPGVAEQTKRPR